MVSKSLKLNQKKDLRSLEQIALELDEGCSSGVMSTNDIENAQIVLNKISARIFESNNPSSSQTYIIYELQALIHLINGEKNDASSLIKSAVKTKGDKNLFTSSARNLFNKIERKSNIIKSLVIGIFVICVISFLSWSLVGANSSIKTLRDDNSSLVSDKNSLQNEIDSLQSKNVELKNRIHDLEDEIDNLEFDLSSNTTTVSVPSVKSICGSAPFPGLSDTEFNRQFALYKTCLTNYSQGIY